MLSFRACETACAPTVDAELLRELIADPLAEVGTPARDATFDVSSGTPKVVPAQTGRVSTTSLAPGGGRGAWQSQDRTATLELERVEPDLTTAEAKDLGVTEVISTFTQEFPYAAYRVTNIGVASEKINGTVLEPGETFSLNGIVGERTPENGFVEGYRHPGRPAGRGLRRCRLDDHHGDVAHRVLRRHDAHRAAGPRLLDLALRGRPGGNGLVGDARPEVPQRHPVRRATSPRRSPTRR